MVVTRPLAPVIKELEDKIKNTPGWTKRFEDAVKGAYDSGIIEMQTITTTSQYLHKINEWLYWIPKENEDGREVYYRICLFYFVMNQPTVKQLQDPIKPGAINIKKSWLTDWLYRYAEELGKWLDDPESIKEKEFQGGMFIHGFLEPNDYYRQYCPLGGKVVWAKNIKGDMYLEVNSVAIPGTDGVKTLVPYRSMDGAAKQFDVPDTPGYQFA
ncbi:MAG: hypothetical protein LQ349_006204 [Xanthoria aureola]|nr:MAG: hypothetical protein LQ349_006204 [Xanthoria aureola]